MIKNGDEEADILRRALAETLRELRQERMPDLSQDALGRRIGIDLAGLERAERSPSLAVVWRLARAFRMTPARLVREIDRRYRSLASPSAAVIDDPDLRPWREFMEKAPTMKWLTDVRHACVYCNGPLLDYLGVSLAELEGDAWVAVIHPEDRERFLALTRKHKSRREPYHSKYRMRRADGAYESMVQLAAPLFTPKGVFIGYLGSLIPIPEPEDVDDDEL